MSQDTKTSSTRTNILIIGPQDCGRTGLMYSLVHEFGKVGEKYNARVSSEDKASEKELVEGHTFVYFTTNDTPTPYVASSTDEWRLVFEYTRGWMGNRWTCNQTLPEYPGFLEKILACRPKPAPGLEQRKRQRAVHKILETKADDKQKLEAMTAYEECVFGKCGHPDCLSDLVKERNKTDFYERVLRSLHKDIDPLCELIIAQDSEIADQLSGDLRNMQKIIEMGLSSSSNPDKLIHPLAAMRMFK